MFEMVFVMWLQLALGLYVLGWMFYVILRLVGAIAPCPSLGIVNDLVLFSALSLSILLVVLSLIWCRIIEPIIEWRDRKKHQY
ncbi:MAG: hypothetical protein WC242_05505 [Candidatus Paceibacterota bacterium]